MFHFKTAKRGKQKDFFVLKAANGEPVGTSEMYSSPEAAKQGAVAMLKATGTYWTKAIATLIEERAESQYAEKADVLTVPEIVRLLMGLSNDDMQKIIDRMPYETNL